MALSGNQKAYLQARAGIARAGAIRANYVFPLFGVVTVGGVDLTKYIEYGSLRITQNINDEPDTCSFNLWLTDAIVQTTAVVGRDVIIGLGGPQENVLFGGRILTAQTTWAAARGPALRSVMCADYLQVLDSEYLITYGWPAQSATTTILDLFKRFSSKVTSFTPFLPISMAGVAADLPSHQGFTVTNEKFSTVLRRLVTMFANGGGFYVDPLKVLHVWQGTSEPNQVNPAPLTIDLPTLKSFAETVDGSQQRDAVLVEGRRTNAPLGLPAADPAATGGLALVKSIPVLDATIGAPFPPPDTNTEIRIGSQRVIAIDFIGAWKAPAGTAQTTKVTSDVVFDPSAGGNVLILVQSNDLLKGRSNEYAWVRIDDQYLCVVSGSGGGGAQFFEVRRTGFGSLIGPITAGAAVTTVDSIAYLTPTGRYNTTGLGIGGPWDEQIRAQPIDADVVLTMRTPTQRDIHEHLVQDGRYTRPGATARGQQEIADFSQPMTSIDFETEDLNAKPGRLIAYSFDFGNASFSPATGQFMILTSEFTWPVWGKPPRIRCHAARVSPADVVDTWLLDPR